MTATNKQTGQPIGVWRCAGCHCSTEVPVPKPTGNCPSCGVYMWDDVRPRLAPMAPAQEHLRHNRDIWGRPYPDGFELCRVCGQPDNCGDCNHERCTDAQYFEMIGADA